MGKLEGKVAIVTGGTRGIGFGIVEKFLAEGAKVALFGSRQETVDTALEKIKQNDPEAPVMGLHPALTDPDEIAAAFKSVVDTFEMCIRDSHGLVRGSFQYATFHHLR